MKLLTKEFRKIDKLLFLDIEGTQVHHEVIELGAVLAQLDEEKNIDHSVPYKQLRIYTKAHESIGKIIISLTGITEETIEAEGISFNDAIRKMNKMIGNAEPNLLVVVFGDQDKLMLKYSATFYPEDNFVQLFTTYLTKRIWDFSSFISRYVLNPDNQTYSLLKLMEIFSVLPCGPAHDSLVDAMNLLNLYDKVTSSPEILTESYLQVLKQSAAARRSSTILNSLNERLVLGETIDYDMFYQELKTYFE